MERAERRSVAPFYAVAVIWLVWGAFSPCMPWGIICCWRRCRRLFSLRWVPCAKMPAWWAAQNRPRPRRLRSREETTGNAEVDKMLRDGRLAIAEMKRLDDSIADEGISADIVRLEQVSQKIFDEVKRDEKKLPQIRKFMDYYLPTTLKLLNSYDRMSAAGVSGENIDTTLAKVEGMMRTIVAAFEKQLDSLYGAEALDISTDITVLENMMAREGLTGGGLKAETAPKDDTDIRLEL